MNKLINLIELQQTDKHILENDKFEPIEHVYSNLQNMRDVANKTNMLFCPLEYFDMDSAFKDEMFILDNKYEVKDSVTNFINYFSNSADIYAMCPLQFYDIQRHLKSRSNKEIYSPNKYEQVFLTINTLMPILRQTENRLSNLEGMQQQLINAQSRSIMLEDPLLFAIPRGTLLQDNQNAIIGTCWGKDIDVSILESMNLKIFNNQSSNKNYSKLFKSKALIEKEKQQELERQSAYENYIYQNINYLSNQIKEIYEKTLSCTKIIDFLYHELNLDTRMPEPIKDFINKKLGEFIYIYQKEQDKKFAEKADFEQFQTEKIEIEKVKIASSLTIWQKINNYFKKQLERNGYYD